MKLGRLCPRCSGVVEQSVEVCETHEADPGEQCPNCRYTTAVRVHWVCTVCKYRGGSSPAGAMIYHPEVVAFYQNHGIDMAFDSGDFEQAKQILTLLRTHEADVISTEPLQVKVTVAVDHDELHLTLDDELRVIDRNVRIKNPD